MTNWMTRGYFLIQVAYNIINYNPQQKRRKIKAILKPAQNHLFVKMVSTAITIHQVSLIWSPTIQSNHHNCPSFVFRL